MEKNKHRESNKSKARAAAMGEKLSWGGAFLAGGANALILWTWGIGESSNAWAIPLLGASTVVSAYIGYYFSKQITEQPSCRNGAGSGAIAGMLVGAINGTCFFPVLGTMIGAGIGLVAGLICGPLMSIAAQSFGLTASASSDSLKNKP